MRDQQKLLGLTKGAPFFAALATTGIVEDEAVIATDRIRAADYIEQHGWFPHDSDGACASNAMHLAEFGCYGCDKRSEAFWDASAKFARAIGGYNCTSIFCWNDTPGRTKDEVVAKLRTVALSL